MQIMTTYSFGDVLLVPFPFTDQTSVKKRPTVIISSNNYNRHKPDLIIMAITSQFNPSLHYGEMKISEFRTVGLLKPSITKPVLTTVEKSLIIKKLGQLNNSDCQNLRELIKSILG